MGKADMEITRKMIEYRSEWERTIGFDRLVERSRLPQTVSIRKWAGILRGYQTVVYTLSYGTVDENVWLSYTRLGLKNPRSSLSVFMHYEESTLADCITKAWRKIAENGVSV